MLCRASPAGGLHAGPGALASCPRGSAERLRAPPAGSLEHRSVLKFAFGVAEKVGVALSSDKTSFDWANINMRSIAQGVFLMLEVKGHQSCGRACRKGSHRLGGGGASRPRPRVLLSWERVMGEHGKPGAKQGGEGCSSARLWPRAHILERPRLGFSYEMEVWRAGFNPRLGMHDPLS